MKYWPVLLHDRKQEHTLDFYKLDVCKYSKFRGSFSSMYSSSLISNHWEVQWRLEMKSVWKHDFQKFWKFLKIFENYHYLWNCDILIIALKIYSNLW